MEGKPTDPVVVRAPGAARPLRVLLVGDDRAAAALIVVELERAFGAVSATSVSTAETFRERLASSSWDAVIAAPSHAGLGAIAALEALQATRRDVPFVIVSEVMSVGEAVAAMRLGARDCLGRSELSRLGPVVERELREAWVRRELRESERARAQERVERELVSKQLEIIRSLANDILLIVSADGRIVEANDRAAAAYGCSIDELLRLNVRDLRPERARAEFEAQIRAAVSKGGGHYTTWHRRRSGELFPVAVSARPIEVAGEVLVQSIIRDLTDEHVARAAIEREALLVEHLDEAVIGLDRGLHVEAWNRAAERLFGLPRAEALGKALPGLVETELPGGRSFEEVARAAEAGGATRVDVRQRARSGELLDGELTVVAVRDAAGAMIGYVAVLRDITQRKRVEAALRESQERLARVLETSSEGIWIVDVEGRVDFVNRRGAELFGVPQEALVNHRLVDLVGEGPARADALEDLAAIQRGVSTRRELVHVRADGQRLHLAFSQSILRGADGRIAGAVAIFMDVTAQRRAWDELVQAQKMEAVGRLASGIAHDFNNLLVGILTNSDFLSGALAPDDPRRQDAVEIHEAGERAARLVRQLLTFARRSVVSPVPTDLNTVIAGFERLVRRTIGEDVRVEAHLAEGLWPTRVDPGNVEQVVMNLAVNARDAMPGGGTLRVETRNEEVPAGAGAGVPPGRYAVLVVEDDGAGIPPDVLPRIFEPFFTTKQPGKGTGLGLSTVHGIVEQAGGRISVSSAPGHGARFTIRLPACDEQPAQPRAAAEGAARGHGERLLLVEDDDGVRGTLRRLLERSGYVVLEATNGREALDRFQANADIALVLSDSVMPEGSGPALAAAVRGSRRAVPVVLMSGYADRESGPDLVIAKPFTADALLVTVRRALAPSPGAAP